jgi:hypothetical protein
MMSMVKILVMNSMIWHDVDRYRIIMNMEWHDVYGKETDHEYMMLNIVAVVRMIINMVLHEVYGKETDTEYDVAYRCVGDNNHEYGVA